MPNKRWKDAERRAAKILGGENCRRTPLSGSLAHTDAQQSKNDTDHPTMHIEVRQRVSHGVWSWFRETKAQAEREAKLSKRPRKVPVVALDEVRAHGLIVCVHSDDLKEFCEKYLAIYGKQKKKSRS